MDVEFVVVESLGKVEMQICAKIVPLNSLNVRLIRLGGVFLVGETLCLAVVWQVFGGEFIRGTVLGFALVGVFFADIQAFA